MQLPTTHMVRSIILAAFLWTAPAMASEAPDPRLAGDIALTKATISVLAAKDFTTFRQRLDASMSQATDDILNRMSDRIGAGEPRSIETISATETHDIQTGDGNSRILLEYGLAGRWSIVDAVVRTEGGSKRFVQLYITTNNQSLRELNAFHFLGKGPMQYAFLGGWLTVIALTAFAMVLAFRGHTGWRRWALVLAMPLGLTPTVALNWSSAHTWVIEATSNAAGQVIPIFAIRYPMAFLGHTELGATYFYVSAPLIAFGYLVWYAWHGRRPLAASTTRMAA